MERTIKFRGKSVATNEWVYGYYVYTYPNEHRIFGKDKTSIEVMPETVGQYTGLMDKDGKEIYEGDIIEGSFSFWMEEDEHIETFTGDVCFAEGAFAIESDIYANFPIIQLDNVHIKGNIHDNPEMLNE